MNKLNAFLLMACLFFAMPSQAVVETYDFSNETLHKRYQIMVQELRCPKCQNQNLADSNSPIAADLRRELYRMLEAGSTDENIKEFMVKRYGNFVLYKPPFDKHTVVLWLTPLLLLIFASVFVIAYRRRSQASKGYLPLSIAQKNKIEQLLNEHP